MGADVALAAAWAAACISVSGEEGSLEEEGEGVHVACGAVLVDVRLHAVAILILACHQRGVVVHEAVALSIDLRHWRNYPESPSAGSSAPCGSAFVIRGLSLMVFRWPCTSNTPTRPTATQDGHGNAMAKITVYEEVAAPASEDPAARAATRPCLSQNLTKKKRLRGALKKRLRAFGLTSFMVCISKNFKVVLIVTGGTLFSNSRSMISRSFSRSFPAVKATAFTSCWSSRYSSSCCWRNWRIPPLLAGNCFSVWFNVLTDISTMARGWY